MTQGKLGTGKGDLRRHPRIEINTELQLMWKDRDGNEKYTNAKTINVSESGLNVEVPEPLPERSYVILRVDKLNLHGTASVRSCRPKKTRFVVGLEFSAGMRYMPKGGTKVAPKVEAPESWPFDELSAPDHRYR
jgi:hypothetical protein